jgi:hypothetical protein
MPEGPSLALLRQDLAPLEGLTVRRARGSSRIDLAPLRGQPLGPIRTWCSAFPPAPCASTF